MHQELRGSYVKIVIVSEVSKRKNKYHMLSLIYGNFKKWYK